LSTIELASLDYQVLDGPDHKGSINTIIQKMDSTNGIGSNGAESSGVGSNGTESNGVGSNGTASSGVGNGSATNSSSVPQTHENTPSVYSDEQWRDELLSLNYRNVAVHNNTYTPIGADFNNNSYQNATTQELRDDHNTLTNFREEAMRNSDFLADQQDRPETRDEQQNIVRADSCWLKEVKDSDKLLKDIEDELRRR
jgi:hypothetical protein